MVARKAGIYQLCRQRNMMIMTSYLRVRSTSTFRPNRPCSLLPRCHVAVVCCVAGDATFSNKAKNSDEYRILTHKRAAVEAEADSSLAVHHSLPEVVHTPAGVAEGSSPVSHAQYRLLRTNPPITYTLATWKMKTRTSQQKLLPETDKAAGEREDRTQKHEVPSPHAQRQEARHTLGWVVALLASVIVFVTHGLVCFEVGR